MNTSKRIKYILFSLGLWLNVQNSFSQAPPWAWAKGVHSGAAEWATDVAVDSTTGEVVVVGVFNGGMASSFGLNFTAAIGGGFVAKYDASGNLLWAFPIGNNQDDACNGVTVSPLGNIYVTGYLQNIADFKGTSIGSTILTSAGGKDIFLAKYNSAGQLQWARRAGGAADDEGYAVCTNSSTIFITGYFTNSGNFSGIPTISNMPSENLFVAAYDANGNIQWLTDGGSGLNTFGRDIVADNNNVYLTGDYKNGNLSIYDYSGANAANLANASPSKEDAWVMSISVAGPFNWIQGIQSGGKDFGRGIAQNVNGVYVTGSISSSANFGGYVSNPVNVTAMGLDMFVAQLDKTTGAANWVNSEKGPSDEEGNSVCVDTSNAIYVAGYFQSTLAIGSGPTITSSGNEDVFVIKYSTAGIFSWVKQAGDNGKDVPYGISCGAGPDIYTAGEYENNAVFGTNVLIADSPPNIFLAKIGCAPLANNNVTANQTICEGSTPATLNGSSPIGGSSPYNYLWQQSADNLTWLAAGGANNTQNYAPPALVANTYFRRAVTSGIGCSGSDTSGSILITVDKKPSTANAGVDSVICGNALNMWANTPTVGVGTWTLVSGGGTIASANSPTTSITALNAGMDVFAWTISNAGVCPPSSDTLSIQVYTSPTPAAAGADQIICSSTYTLNGNNPVTGSGAWSVITGSATVTSPASYNSTATGLSTGQNIFVWTITNGTCGSSSDTVRIKVDAMPGVSFAGNDQTICSSTYTLNATAPATGTGTWNVLSGGSTVTNPLQNNSSVTGLTVGVNNLEWVVSNGSCPANKDTVTIIVNANPSVANAGGDQTICSSTYTLNASPPATGTGAWSVYSGGATIVSMSAPNATATNLSNGYNIFIWTVSNGTCPSSSDSVTIAVDTLPTTANAGSPQTLCNDSVFLNANIPSVGNGTWSVVSGGATLANVPQNNSLAYNLAVGSNVFMWSISSGVCPASSATVQIVVDAKPSVAFAGTDQAICSTSYTLNATAPSVGTGNWSVISGGATVANPTSNNSGASGLSIGMNVFVWTVSNGMCPANADTVQVNVDANPSAADAGNTQSICTASTVISAVMPVTGTGTWNVLSGGATVASPTQNNSTVTGLSLGLNAIEWVVSNGSCTATRDTLYITVDANPTTASAGNDQTLCSSNSSLLANTPVTGNGAWTTIAGGGSVTSANQPATTVINLTSGQNIFVWTITSGACPASSDTVVINVDVMPSANAGPSQVVCSTSANLSAVVPPVGTGTWTVTQGAASVVSINNANSAVTGLSNGINIFQWTVTNGTCPAVSDTVVINVSSPPSPANAGSDQTICATSTSLLAVIPANGSGVWSVLSGGGTIASVNSYSTAVSNLSTGQNIFIWTVSSGVCPSSSDTVIVTLITFPSPSNAGADQNVCIDQASAILGAVIPPIGNGAWTEISGSGTINNPNQNNSAVSGLSVGQNTFVWTVTNGLCPSSKDTVNVFVFPDPTIANAGPDISVNGPNASLSANIPTAGTGVWAGVSGTGTVLNSSNASTTVSGLSIGDNVFSWTISNGVCPASTDDVIIHVNTPAVPNGFSPNGDNVNDNFEIPGLDLFKDVKLEVFNRWGNLVYQNTDYKNDWNGKNLAGEDLTDDTYYFVLTIPGSKAYKNFVVLKRK